MGKQMQITFGHKLVSLGLAALALFGCKKPKSVEVEVRKGASLDASAAFDESKYTNEQRLLGEEYGAQVAGPESPSIFMILESSESDSRIIDVSLSLNVWGVGSDSKTVTNLMLQYTPGLALHKHTKKDDIAIIDDEGEIIWKADNPPVAQCSYDAMVLSSATGTGTLAANPKIPFIGAGGGTSVSFEKAVEDMGLISGSSNFFIVRQGEKIADLNRICREIFDASHKEVADKMLKTLIEKKFIMDERQGFERVMKAAAGGPKEMLKDVNGLEFNVDDVLAKVKDGGKSIGGGLKDLGGSVKDKIGGLGLTANDSIAEPIAAKKNLCFDIQLDLTNVITSEKYDNCAGGPIDPKDDIYRRAIQVAQEIAMTSGQYLFTARQFPGVQLKLLGD